MDRQRERVTRRDRIRKNNTQRDFKELVYAVTGAGKSTVGRAGPQAGNSDRISMLQSGGRISSSPGHLFLFSMSSTVDVDETTPIHYQG